MPDHFIARKHLVPSFANLDPLQSGYCTGMNVKCGRNSTLRLRTTSGSSRYFTTSVKSSEGKEPTISNLLCFFCSSICDALARRLQSWLGRRPVNIRMMAIENIWKRQITHRAASRGTHHCDFKLQTRLISNSERRAFSYSGIWQLRDSIKPN